VVANNRLIEALEADTWDGRNMDAELARLDQESGVHHVFCSADDRLIAHPDGRIDLADEERDLVLPQDVRSALDALAERLLARFRVRAGRTRQVDNRGNAGSIVPEAIKANTALTKPPIMDMTASFFLGRKLRKSSGLSSKGREGDNVIRKPHRLSGVWVMGPDDLGREGGAVAHVAVGVRLGGLLQGG
jgi:hypothetical protein